MRMPGMNGVELLSRVKDSYPETVRLMLTGNADQETAMEAVNDGQIFRFLTNPCPQATFITSLALALRQYRLIIAERELLQKTLMGSVTVCLEVLAVVCLGGDFWSQEKEAGTTGTQLAGSSDQYRHGRHKGNDGKK